jgi:hypothetical protein
MIGYCSRHGFPDAAGRQTCTVYEEPDPKAGAVMLWAGLTLLVAGGILLGSGLPNPPPEPAPSQ